MPIGEQLRCSQNALDGASLKRDHDGGDAGPPRSDRSAGERGQSSDGERAVQLQPPRLPVPAGPPEGP